MCYVGCKRRWSCYKLHMGMHCKLFSAANVFTIVWQPLIIMHEMWADNIFKLGGYRNELLPNMVISLVCSHQQPIISLIQLCSQPGFSLYSATTFCHYRSWFLADFRLICKWGWKVAYFVRQQPRLSQFSAFAKLACLLYCQPTISSKSAFP